MTAYPDGTFTQDMQALWSWAEAHLGDSQNATSGQAGVVLVALSTGLPVVAMARLSTRSVRKLALLPGPTGEEGRSAAKLINNYADSRKGGPLFPSRYGTPCGPDALRHRFRKALGIAGLCRKSYPSFPSAWHLGLVGQVFGQLTVVGASRPVRSGGRMKRKVSCACSCGGHRLVRPDHLKSGETHHCGCLSREAWARAARTAAMQRWGGRTADEKREAAIASLQRALLHRYRVRAKRRGLAFLLTPAAFFALVRSRCRYCNALPYQEFRLSPTSASRRATPSVEGVLVYTGIDRVDNERGYDVDNCVPCCKTCNTAKMTMGAQDFAAWVERVHSHLSLFPLPERVEGGLFKYRLKPATPLLGGPDLPHPDDPLFALTL